MLSFSQRIGAVKTPDSLISGEASEELRNRIWNILESLFWQHYRDTRNRSNTADFIVKLIWAEFLNWRLDEMPHNQRKSVLNEIKHFFFDCEWHEFFSLLEFLSNIEDITSFDNDINNVLEKEYSSYRLVEGYITEIDTKEERVEISKVIINSPHKHVKDHIVQALKLLSDKNDPDFRNSIKESISAVEAMSKKIVGSDKATLGEALKVMEQDKKLHPALKGAFSQLYGYTCDADGIRHSLLNESNLTMADARYMLITCSAFVNYLIDTKK